MSDADHAAEPRHWPDSAAAVALLLLTVSVVLGRLGWWTSAPYAASVAVVVYLLLQCRKLNRGGLIGLGATLTVGAAALFTSDPARIMGTALERVAFFAALLTALAFLREAAGSSRLLRRAGSSLLHHPARRRYLFMTTASHLVSIVMNFGVIYLFTPLILRLAPRGSSPGDSLQVRRLTLAMLRGFAAMCMWSPLSLSFAVTVESMGGAVPELPMMAVGAVGAVLIMTLGWTMEPSPPDDAAFTTRAHGIGDLRNVIGIAIAVVGIASGMAYLLNASLIMGVIVACPVIAMGWACMTTDTRQHAGETPSRALRHIGAGVVQRLPTQRNEMAILGGAAFIGAVVGEVVTPGMTSHVIDTLRLSGLGIAMAASLLIVAVSQLGIGPLISVSVLGSALATLPQGPAPLLLGVSLMGGWGIAVGVTPVAAGTLSIGHLLSLPASRVSRGWNGPFSILALFVFCGWLAVLSLLI